MDPPLEAKRVGSGRELHPALSLLYLFHYTYSIQFKHLSSLYYVFSVLLTYECGEPSFLELETSPEQLIS